MHFHQQGIHADLITAPLAGLFAAGTKATIAKEITQIHDAVRIHKGVCIHNAVMRSLHVVPANGLGFAGPMTGSSWDPLIADVAMSRHPEV